METSSMTSFSPRQGSARSMLTVNIWITGIGSAAKEWECFERTGLKNETEEFSLRALSYHCLLWNSTDKQLVGEEPQTGTQWLNSSFSSETNLKGECTAICSTVAGKLPVNRYSWSETTFLPPMCHLTCEMHLKTAGQLSFENVSESLKTLLIICTDWRIELNWMTNCLNMHANRCLHVSLRETVDDDSV